MSISSISPALYSTLLTKPSSVAGGVPAASSSSSTGTSASDAVMQELVSLGSASSAQKNSAPQVYNAQGLLQQIQKTFLENDPLMQADASSASSTTDSSAFIDSSAGLQTPAESSSATDMAQMLKQNPSYAAFVVQSQMNQSLIAALG